ncbi:MAG: cysteine desulfurase [Acidobacteriota bacterium]
MLASELEHHSNVVPWQIACAEAGAELVPIPVSAAGSVDLAALDALLDSRTKVVAVAHVGNALGTVVPVARIAARAHAVGAWVVVDGAQAAPHLCVDVRSLGADFYAVSGHKLFGPMGTGILYGRAEILETLPPYEGGGEMIREVTFARTEYAESPHRFEAGTPNVAGIIGLGAAIDYLSSLGMEHVAEHDRDLVSRTTDLLERIPGIRVAGSGTERAAIVSFRVEGYEPHEVGLLLDQAGIAVRTGDHCAQPLMRRLGLPGGTCRASFALYNVREDVDALASALSALS